MSAPPADSQARSLLAFADRVGQQTAGSNPPTRAVELHLVTFGLEREEFAVPIHQVREVITVGEITRVPEAPPHIRGVTNLRGRILPVVEIRTRVGLSAAIVTPKSRIVVVEVRDRVLGILVDSVAQVVKVPSEVVVPAPAEVLSPGTDYITGVARWNSRLLILLDLEKALSIHE